MSDYFKRKDVQQALHLGQPGLSTFHYETTGPASITLYPYLAKRLRMIIYNGDADMCVPYNGNEEWIDQLASEGVLRLKTAWQPWYAVDDEGGKSTAAGGFTLYSVPGSDQVLTFLTIRLAGHMVPLFRPTAALDFFEKFITHKPQ